MYPYLRLTILAGVLITSLGCKGSREKEAREAKARREAWWAEKSQVIQESAKRNNGFVVDVRSSRTDWTSDGIGWRRWYVVIPLDSKLSGDKMRTAVLAADDFAKSLLGDQSLLGQTGCGGDYWLGTTLPEMHYKGDLAIGSGPYIVRQVESLGSGGALWIKAHVLTRGDTPDFHAVTLRESERPSETKKVLFLDIGVAKWCSPPA